MTFATRSAFTTRPTLDGSFGMAASTHWLASQSAMAVLERGGNAFDAAVACGLVLQVVEPHLNGPGGDLVGMVAPAGGPSRVLCGQGTAPAEATIDTYRGFGLDLVPGAGLLAATVPGAFDAWLLLLKDHGTWELADVAEFALHYAHTGYPVLPPIARTIGTVRNLFLDSWTTSAENWLTDGATPEAGTLRTSPAWAETLTRLIAAGTGDSREERIDAVRREWAEGFIAQEIDRFARTPVRDSSGEDHPGVLRASDLAGWRASWEAPVRTSFRGHTVLKPGFWTQGPTLLQALSILDGFADDELDPGTPGGAHRMLEAMKLAMADREAYYGDSTPAADVLLREEYAAQRRALIGESASRDLRPGRIDGLQLRLPATRSATASAPGTGEPTVARTGVTKGDTCHLDIVDRHGNMISVTPSGGWLQSSPYIPELGFALGSRLQMMWLDEGLPSSLAPGRRPRTTLSPTLVERAGVAVLSVGTPGGDSQDQWQLPFLLRVLAGGLELQQAIDAPSLHSTNAPESFWPRERIPAGVVAEESLGGELLAELLVRGHDVTLSSDWTLGRLSAVSRDADGRLRAAANPRGMQGYAVGR
ncbi:gamma-glutamyltransferase family protein [Lysobacter korlensis]|uniref:Gamma-glutamyltransferase family protein n=1 Tax=Lysobacter korlensis TaxID=553636 RepID=A0ABV6RUK5_9GAMM